MIRQLLLVLLSLYNALQLNAFCIVGGSSRQRSTTFLGSTIAPPRPTTIPGTDTDTDEGVDVGPPSEEEVRKEGPLEYLEDDETVDRMLDDPFHILLMSETYDLPRITVKYVAGSLQFVLQMPLEDAEDSAVFAKDNGFSVLGTWSREQCLTFGRELQQRDLSVRVVPYCEGGGRGWQAKEGDGSDFIDVPFEKSGGGDFA